MYQSVPSMATPMQANPWGFFERVNSPQPGTKKVQNPNPLGRKIMLKKHPWGNFCQKSSKQNTKHEREIIKTKYLTAGMFRNI